MNYKKQSTVPEVDKKFEIRASKKPERQKGARDNYRSTEVTDLTLTLSDLQNVNEHCANVKSASCDPNNPSVCQVSRHLYQCEVICKLAQIWPEVVLFMTS